MAAHKVSQKSLPVVVIGAGLPQLIGKAGRAKSYAERLFDYPELGSEPQRSGDVAEELGLDVQNAAPLRNNLIKKGMIYSPKHGDTAFTVSLFEGFMKRIIPNFPGKIGEQ